jgi:hypothetical protein
MFLKTRLHEIYEASVNEVVVFSSWIRCKNATTEFCYWRRNFVEEITLQKNDTLSFTWPVVIYHEKMSFDHVNVHFIWPAASFRKVFFLLFAYCGSLIPVMHPTAKKPVSDQKNTLMDDAL